MANKEKLSSPVAMRCAIVVKAASESIETAKVSKQEIPIDQATGTPKLSRIKNEMTNNNISAIIASIF